METPSEKMDKYFRVWFAEDGEIFVTFSVGKDNQCHLENHPLESLATEGWIRRTLRKINNKAPTKNEVENFKNDLKSKAYEEGVRCKTALRTGESEGKIYIDLGMPDWACVEITETGWEVLPVAGVAFRRNDHMQPLPIPQRGGYLSLLKDFVSLETEEDFLLLCSWLISALHPNGPYFHLILTGEKGSSKSSLARLMQNLIHPSSSSLKGLPKDDENMAIEAYHNRLVMIDNENDLGKWLPNALCRLATGTGTSARTHYSWRGQSAFTVARPAIITALYLPTKQEDLLERSFHIRVLKPNRHITIQKLKERFDMVSGQIFGAILDAISMSLAVKKIMPEENLRLHRMADASYFIACAAEKIGWKSPEDFLKALKRNQMNALENAGGENLPLIQSLCKLMKDRSEWEGEPQKLLDDLNAISGDNDLLPKAANALSRSLNALQSHITPYGLIIKTGLRTKGGKARLINIRKIMTIFDHEENTVMPEAAETNGSDDTTI